MSAESRAMLDRAVCVYCASSTSAHPEYREAAFRMGEVLAGRGITLIYGGGSRGSMGWPAQVPRTHAWSGSSQMRQARSPGPAITFR